MKRMDLLSELVLENQTKLVLFVIDGLGGLPGKDGKTELEAAATPNLDKLAAKSETGLLQMIEAGITPGSGPGHLALFGYDPLEFRIGRGILEALGVGAHVAPQEVCARGNFATWGPGDVVLDRRAGRISTEKNKELISFLSENIKEIRGVKVRLYPGEEHRFVVVFSGDNLSEEVEDADPQKNGLPMRWANPSSARGNLMATIANEFIKRVRELLAKEEHANGCLLRGFSQAPHMPMLSQLYKIKPVAIATYPMYKGIARLVGMDVVDVVDREHSLEGLFEALSSQWDKYDFFYVHVKYADSYGEDGNYDAKREIIERFDSLLPKAWELKPDVLVVTGDHSTPSRLKSHSWHPVPVLLSSPFVRPSGGAAFGERTCASGTLGIMPAHHLMGLMLAHGLRLAKYGA